MRKIGYDWSKDEVDFLIKHNYRPHSVLSKQLKRSKASVCSKMYMLRRKGLLPNAFWTNEEVAILEDYLNHNKEVRFSKLFDKLPNRSSIAIKSKARRIKNICK